MHKRNNTKTQLIQVHILQRTISYHIISYHIISYHIISYHIMSCHVMSCHVISYHIIYHIITYHTISYIISYIILYLGNLEFQKTLWRFIHFTDCCYSSEFQNVKINSTCSFPTNKKCTGDSQPPL